MTELLLVLFSVGVSIGLSEEIDYWRRKSNSKAGLGVDDVIKVIQLITNTARKQGNEAISKVDKALNSVQTKLNQLASKNNSIYIDSSGKLNDYIRNVKSKLQDDYDKELKKQENLNEIRINTQELANNVERSASNLENRAINLANQTEAYKNSDVGRTEFNNLKKDAENIMKQYKFQNVEKPIGEK